MGGIDGREEHRISVTTLRATAWMSRASYRSTAPSDSVLSEIRTVCERDATVLGEVSCMTDEGQLLRRWCRGHRLPRSGSSTTTVTTSPREAGLPESRDPSPGVGGNLSA